MEKRRININTAITIITFVGSVIGIWRAVELKAFAIEQEQKEMRKKLTEHDAIHQKMLDQLGQNGLLLEKTSTILDQHLKYHLSK